MRYGFVPDTPIVERPYSALTIVLIRLVCIRPKPWYCLAVQGHIRFRQGFQFRAAQRGSLRILDILRLNTPVRVCKRQDYVNGQPKSSRYH